MRISDFFKPIRKKREEPGTDHSTDHLFEPETGPEPPQVPEPAGTVPEPAGTEHTLPELFEPETGPEPLQAPEPAGTVRYPP